MNIKSATLLVIIGMICSLSIRTVGTLFPGIFQNIHIVHTAIGTHLFSSAALVHFFITLYGQWIPKEQRRLKLACILAIIGSLAALFLHGKSLLLVLEIDVLPLLVMHHHTDAMLPLVSSSLVLLFFVFLRVEMGHRASEGLRRATDCAIAGFSVFMILHAIVLVNYSRSGTFQWLEHFPGTMAVGGALVFACAAAAILCFFISFYRFKQ